jgi:hypothetical protein
MPAPVATGPRQYQAAAKLSPAERQLLHGVMAKHELNISQAMRLGLLQLASEA